MLLTLPFALSAARADGDSTTPWLIMGAFVLKLCGAVARYYVAFSVYGTGDSQAYHDVGAKLAPMFRHGDFSIDLGKRVLGTGFIEIVTGAVYTVTGATKLGGFFVFSWLGFIGLFLFYRAFCIAFPDGDRLAVCPPGVLPAVAAVLALEHRQGIVDDAHARSA